MAICIGKGFYQSFYEDKNEKCPLKKTEQLFYVISEKYIADVKLYLFIYGISKFVLTLNEREIVDYSLGKILRLFF